MNNDHRQPATTLLTRRTLLVAGISLTATGGLGIGAEASKLADIVAAFDRERERRNVPSISVALVENGRLSLYQRGVLSAARGDEVGPETRYQAASISKTVAAVTAVAVTGSGSVSLNADVNSYLKRWHPPQLPPGSSKAVTLRRLFGMTAGCDVPGFSGYQVGTPLPNDVQILDGKPPANSPPVRIVSPPGTTRSYSGGGCQIAQVALEDATGQPFAELAAKSVLARLAMHRSGFFQPPDPSWRSAFAVAHDDSGHEIADGWHVYPELAAAGLWSTPSDLAQLILAMIAAHGGETDTVMGRSGLADIFTSVDGLGYGLGIALAGAGGRLIAMKRGNNLGFRNALVACPATGQGAVVMTNGNAGEETVDAVLDAFAEQYRWPGRAPWPE